MKPHPLLLLALFSLLPLHSFASPPILLPLDDHRTPLEREQAQIREGYAAGIADARSCSPNAKQKLFGSRIILPESLVFIAGRNPVAAKFFIDDMLNTINRAIQTLVRNGDQEILNRRVCVGLYNYGEMNARSYPHGYILADPIVIGEMQNLPNHTMFSDQQVYLHEFAHQLQFRYGNEFAGDRTSKRGELTADCIGSALLAASWQGLNQEILNMESLGVVSSAERVGDRNINDPDHHGTPEERALMARAGFNLVKSHYAFFPTGNGLTSRTILLRCSALARGMR